MGMDEYRVRKRGRMPKKKMGAVQMDNWHVAAKNS